jgi:hypothetical protein
MEKQFSKLTLSDAVVSPMNLRNNKRLERKPTNNTARTKLSRNLYRSA